MFYLELFRALEEESVRYLLIGGVAVNLHGVARYTADVDIMIALDAPNLSRFVAAAQRFSLKPVIPVALSDFADADKVRTWIEEKGMLAFALKSPDPAAPSLDVLVRPVVPFEEAYARRVEGRVQDLIMSIAAIEDIIRLKTGTGRQKDEADIQALEQVLRIRERRNDG